MRESVKHIGVKSVALALAVLLIAVGIGVSGGEASFDALCARADDALYRSKKAEGNARPSATEAAAPKSRTERSSEAKSESSDFASLFCSSMPVCHAECRRAAGSRSCPADHPFVFGSSSSGRNSSTSSDGAAGPSGGKAASIALTVCP